MFLPQTVPIIRMGHLARLGWDEIYNGNVITRPHVIDLHSSPGNSGATVVVYGTTEDKTKYFPRFLGIIQGFREETDSYKPYEALITNRLAIGSSVLTLVNAETAKTNNIVVTKITVANPNLTSVTPVHELIGLGRNRGFLDVVVNMGETVKDYQATDGPVVQ